MIYRVDEGEYDRKLLPSDWRFAAAAVGLVKYFEFHRMDFEYERDALLYRSEDVGIPVEADGASKEGATISKEKEYFAFVEDYFRSEMHHCNVEDLLRRPETLSAEQIKFVNAKLGANAVMKKVFKGYKYSEPLRQEIEALIKEHRIELTRETFRMMLSGYRKYANVNLLRTKASNLCRLVGYNVDVGRKTQGISYNFDFGNFNGKDAIEFDFIPFAFTKAYEGIFINNNFKLDMLVHANKTLQRELDLLKEQEQIRREREELQKEKRSAKETRESVPDPDFRKLLFFSLKQGASYIDYDVEIIVKERDEDYFKTLLVRKDAVEVFKKLQLLEKDKTEEDKNLHKALTRPCRLSSGEYLPIMKSVTDHILNRVHLDGLIETLLKDRPREDGRSYRHGALIYQLIRINEIMYKGGDSMNDKSTKAAFAASKEVVAELIKLKADNKIPSYRQKLISSLVFKNYNRFIEVALQLSSYTQVPMGFLYNLSEDFEANKNLAYIFVNGLENFDKKNKGEKEDAEK